ncbi:MAG TPA: hypothetical protein VF702_08620 [Allosphingosinicella sp.]|jgi:hypothetical protein
MPTNSLIAGLAALLLAEAPVRTGSFTGTWIADLTSQQGLPTDVYSLRDGAYRCASCVPAREHPADGRMHAVAQNLSEAVTIVDARTIATFIVQPEFSRTTTMRVARDGRTATYVSVDWRRGIQGPLRTTYVARRVAAGPPGSHSVSGSWQGVRYVSVPIQLRTTTLVESATGLSYRTGSGYFYTAAYEGPFVPVGGPYDGSILVSVRKDSSHRLVERRRRGGTDIEVRTYTLAPDGRSMEIATTNLATNTTFRITARRQGRRRPAP